MVTSPAGTQGAAMQESAWSLHTPPASVNTSRFSPELADSFSGLGAIALPATPLFGTDGIRGRVGELLSAPLALQVGFWTGQVLRMKSCTPGPVIVGQDSRNSSDMLAMALCAGLASSGLEIWYLGLCPTPCVAYLTSVSKAVGGVMISASHNPPEDNGILGRMVLNYPSCCRKKLRRDCAAKLHFQSPTVSGDGTTRDRS